MDPYIYLLITIYRVKAAALRRVALRCDRRQLPSEFEEDPLFYDTELRKLLPKDWRRGRIIDVSVVDDMVNAPPFAGG